MNTSFDLDWRRLSRPILLLMKIVSYTSRLPLYESWRHGNSWSIWYSYKRYVSFSSYYQGSDSLEFCWKFLHVNFRSTFPRFILFKKKQRETTFVYNFLTKYYFGCSPTPLCNTCKSTFPSTLQKKSPYTCSYYLFNWDGTHTSAIVVTILVTSNKSLFVCFQCTCRW